MGRSRLAAFAGLCPCSRHRRRRPPVRRNADARVIAEAGAGMTVREVPREEVGTKVGKGLAPR